MRRLRRYPRTRVPVHRRLLHDRRVRRRWAVTLVGTLLVTTGVGRALGRADEVRGRWGPTRSVLVTTGPVPAGHDLAESVHVLEWPVALVPEGALDRLPDGARSRHEVAAGMPLTTVDLAPTGPADGRMVALSTGDARPALTAGDRVDVWATFDPSLAGTGLTTRRVAVGAEVVDVDGSVVVVTVEGDEAADLAAAVATAAVTVTRWA